MPWTLETESEKADVQTLVLGLDATTSETTFFTAVGIWAQTSKSTDPKPHTFVYKPIRSHFGSSSTLTAVAWFRAVMPIAAQLVLSSS